MNILMITHLIIRMLTPTTATMATAMPMIMTTTMSTATIMDLTTIHIR
jgi:hypothetical protein